MDNGASSYRRFLEGDEDGIVEIIRDYKDGLIFFINGHEEDSLEKLYMREERKIIVHKALSKLKLEYRQVLYLTFFEGFNNSQVAIIMKKNTRQIENLIYRAKLSLKSELMKEGMVNEEL